MKNDPLYFTGIAPDGWPLMGGIFTMKDQEGFPVDASYDECEHRLKVHVDWAEYLADAGRQEQWKFDAASKEIEYLLGEATASDIQKRFLALGQRLTDEGNDFRAVCERIVEQKKGNAIAA